MYSQSLTPKYVLSKKTNQMFNTPPMAMSLSKELKQVLNERNLLTAKSRNKGEICVFYAKGAPIHWILEFSPIFLYFFLNKTSHFQSVISWTTCHHRSTMALINEAPCDVNQSKRS